MREPMTNARIASIRKRAEAATVGPWCIVHDGTEKSVEARSLGRFVCHMNSNMQAYWEDAQYIANARTDIPDLLEELDRLVTLIDREIMPRYVELFEASALSVRSESVLVSLVADALAPYVSTDLRATP